ncbi:MAG: MFS transporter [Polyangiaceae bacterium]|nr:MFS transporter [Polyangiaceae bacterium]
MYDWGQSAFTTTIISAVFPIFFISVASSGLPKEQASFHFALTTTIALSVVAFCSPLLGAIADRRPIKKTLLGAFTAVGVIATLLMVFIGEGQWQLAAVLFAIANIGAAGSLIFYDSLLPHLAKNDELDRLSTAGYALGYVGGGILLAINIAGILNYEALGFATKSDATRASFATAAIWWAVFSVSLLRTVPEPAVNPEINRQRFAIAAQLRQTFAELRSYRHALLFLFAFLIYNDGIGTIIRLATAYGTELGLPSSALIGAVLLVQFVGIPFTFLFGAIAGKIGAKSSIYVALAAYAGICVLGYYMTSVTHFYVIAALVGVVQGGCQALSRSLFAGMIPKHKSSEFFGLFSVFNKFAGIIGPGLFSLIIYTTGSSRLGILAIIAFFVLGGLLLGFVDVDAGRQQAREAEDS